MSYRTALVLALILILLLAAAPLHKVTINHVVPPNPGIITIDCHAWPAHKAHGDTIVSGSCPNDPPNPGEHYTIYFPVFFRQGWPVGGPWLAPH